ncbi:MAG: alpha/beta hydrolase [Acetobacteraceae bacterium]|nr:alpha/beta hydrolase [Acetobacteraceae bacterium]
MRLALLRLALAALFASSNAASARDATFTTSDNVRLHVIEQGDPARNTVVVVPGWTMPAWIFQRQIDVLSQSYHVLALDPRGQGESEIAPSGYTYRRRGEDIAELIAANGNRPVVLVGWSLGVLDSLAYVAEYGDQRIAGLVLIDNSIGENPPPTASRVPALRGPRLARDEQMRRFVRGMFLHNPGEAYLERLTADALRTPPEVAAALGNYAVDRSFWRQAVYSVQRPVLYIVRPRFAAQAANLAANDPYAETVLFEHAGHALFVDDPVRFDTLLLEFLRRRVWPS